MKMKLLISALTKFLLGVLLVGLLVFLPAGELYFGGMAFMALLFIPIFILGVVLFVKNPKLLERRLENKEKQSDQKGVVAFSGLIFLLAFIVAGLDFRFGWSRLPRAVSIVAAVLFVAAYLIYAEVLRENAYLSRTIKVEDGQSVVSTGLYGIVRHPMYAATILLFLSIPQILGSLIAFVIFLAYPAIIAVRIKGEEALLEKELEGYAEYKQKVKYKIIPFIW
ncbi:MAG: isoprenylcysteine carboxylmethyltransferase family protein [Clostridia bacterium]|nr:isoprenylcysteine carboxylmethyltransferase family protein [Clostridia bacterium]